MYTGPASGWPSAHWETIGRPSEYLQGTLEHYWKDLVEAAPHWNATGEILTFAVYTGTLLEGLWQPTHAPTHIVKQGSIHAGLKWQDGGTPVNKWTGLCKFSLYLELTALQCIPALLLTHVSTSTSLCECFWYEHHSSFCVFGVVIKWNQLSSNNSHHISCIHKGSHAGKWPDLMTSKPDSVSTLGYHWTDHTGRPLEPQVHGDATGTTLADASTQWCSSGDPVLICIIVEHTGRPLEPQVQWDATGTTLADASTQWCPSGDTVLICIIGTHWKTIGRPLEAHWK